MDAAGIGAAFLPDGETSDADQAPIRGPEAIRAHLQAFSTFHVLANHLEADATRVRADTAWQTGTYWQRVQRPAGDTLEVAGRFAVTWIRVTRQQWRIRSMHTFRPPAA
jgi:ketosteroid isomerase-like protein